MAFENINELYRLKTLLQKPRLKGRYLHSRRSYRNLPGYQQDYQHVRQKINFWRTKPSGDPDEEEAADDHETQQSAEEAPDDPGISMDELMERQNAEDASLHDMDDLCRRLAAANSKRRKQLWYWESHPYLDDAEKLLDMEPPKPFRKTDPIGLNTTDADSFKPPTTAHTFSTAARSAIFPESRDRNNQEEAGTVYEPSVLGGSGRSKLRIPDAPLAAEGENTIECPYCHISLSTDKISNRVGWKRHVFRDLRPYVCTIGGCSDPNRQFVTRYDWTYHESQVHHRQWDCSDCDQAFEDKEAFILHMSDEHIGRWTTRQISLLGELRERGKDDTEWFSCRLCLTSLQKQSYFRHVAAHLEEISLFALPKLVSDGEEQAQSNEANENNAARSLEYDLSSKESEGMSDFNEEEQVELVRALTERLGREHPETLDSIDRLASIYYDQKRWRDSEQLEAELWKSRKESLGFNDQLTLKNMSNVATVLANQDRHEEAEELRVELLKLRKEVLGQDHPDTIRSMADLGSTFSHQDRFEEAKELQVKAMEISKEALGFKHPQTLHIMHLLSSTLANQERYDEAEEMQLELMELYKEVLEPDHEDALRNMANLALVWRSKGRYVEAMDLLQESTERLRTTRGADDIYLHYLNILNSWIQAQKDGDTAGV
ncbi:hypothetical protein PFICI_11812 [Pestalotiopsis fici W106-1]|uniref:C2H2-type domain-containing protein n=1 Tax=Pestalotiopsis fici (strain W106-1 / CGMCC3.15140) TaxID=1229662 RepID=W3WRD1_PESFW|nr:uncharacterized protein PFICI_11812 [Pestalotiopsis fici W106-1]ETS76425.1 hypothetical protein PFICI_11812 [Pestalotiopsis fici W106-1]